MKMYKASFYCPRCGKETEKADGIVRAVEVSSEIDNKYGYNPSRFTIVTKYHNIWFCKSCSDKMTRNHYLRHVLWFVIPQILCLILGICLGKSPWMLMALAFTISIVFYVLAVSLYRDVKMKLPYTKKLLQKAREGNSMA